MLGLVLRLITASQLVSADSFVRNPPSVTDMATYQQFSDEILHGKFPDIFYYQPFYYTVFLPFWKGICRSAVWGVVIGQALCSAGVIWFSGLSAAILRGRRCGIIAAFLACFSTLLVFYVPYALIEIQQAFWFTLLFYLTLQGWRRNRWFLWGCAGVILSFAILSRGNAWCFFPIIVFFLLLAGRRTRTGWKKQIFHL